MDQGVVRQSLKEPATGLIPDLFISISLFLWAFGREHLSSFFRLFPSVTSLSPQEIKKRDRLWATAG